MSYYRKDVYWPAPGSFKDHIHWSGIVDWPAHLRVKVLHKEDFEDDLDLKGEGCGRGDGFGWGSGHALDMTCHGFGCGVGDGSGVGDNYSYGFGDGGSSTWKA